MNSMELIATIRKAAKLSHASGRKSSDIFHEADQMDCNGNSVSAPFHRLLGQAVKELEDKSALDLKKGE